MNGTSTASAKKILLVDDDEGLRMALSLELGAQANLAVTEAGTAAAALDAARDDHFDAVILDVGLPDMDGRQLCRLLRRDDGAPPIIMLSGVTAEADQMLAFESGASDYVTKPFSLDLLLARLRVQLRNQEQSDAAAFSVGPYIFQPAARLLVDRETQVKTRLTPIETAILKCLIRSDTRSADRKKLLADVWGDDPGATTHALETHIYRLRRKLAPDAAGATLLATQEGGYSLNL